jgi:hypothetical protein
MTLEKLESNLDPSGSPPFIRTAADLLAGGITGHIRIDLRTFDARALLKIKGTSEITALQVNRKGLENICSIPWIKNLHLQIGTFSDLRPLGKLKNLRFLSILGNPGLRSLKGIQDLRNLTGLLIMDAKNLRSLDQIAGLKKLEALHIRSGIWSSMSLKSLRPLVKLSSLRLLILGGVDVKDKNYSHILKLKKLRRFHCGSRLTLEEFALLAAQFRHIEFTPSKPYYKLQNNLYVVEGPDRITPINVFDCKKCGLSEQVQIIGKRGPALCINCDSERLQNYVDRYNRAYNSMTGKKKVLRRGTGK